ncbi:hypothetical protein EW026_g8092 [Hermanssonia centrifuga]|uniref:Fe2OG dioxygenase domain-containing protein n=1 Tax=Hermanssonia centrifuga TaxID=98765 RepID=A0A4S4K6J9_9APHY|nr:hypothetical protein EW026_g8092 [Hermanssonia centrifuga]
MAVADDTIFYEIVTRFWHPHLTKIHRNDLENLVVETVAEIERVPGREPRVRFGGDKGEWVGADAFVQFDEERGSGTFLGGSNVRYRWETDKGRLQLVNADDDEHTPIAGFHPHRRHFFVFRMSKHAFIEIKPVPEIAQDMEKLIGEQQQQSSYPITSLMPLSLARSFTEERGNVHRGKIIKYPVGADSDQGVGPHFDGGFLTLLLQATEHRGLQVQNLGGEWIDAPPVPGTFVVNIGKALEAVTQGVAIATSHRVLSPASGARYSVPFFQMIAQDVVIGKSVLAMPVEMLALRDARGKVASDSVNYAEYGQLAAGQVMLIGRIKSHPDVGQRHYPQLFHQLFPHGLPAHGSAY